MQYLHFLILIIIYKIRFLIYSGMMYVNQGYLSYQFELNNKRDSYIHTFRKLFWPFGDGEVRP